MKIPNTSPAVRRKFFPLPAAFGGLTAAAGGIRVPAVTHRPSADNFLRAAVKTGLRLQRSESAESGEGAKSAGVRTLQRIKRSLQKQNSNSKSKL